VLYSSDFMTWTAQTENNCPERYHTFEKKSPLGK
jgi:hypothetical protein